MRGRALVCALALAIPIGARAVRADEPVADADADTPWSRGVTDDAKAKAQALLEDGNALIVQNLFREALVTYEAALTAWDHPAIRFNMVRALIALDRPLEALDNLERALIYGAAPLGPEVFAEASTYQRLLAQQIGTLEVRCDQAGVTVSVDGEPLGPCPGAYPLRLRVGPHTIAADGADRLAITRREAVAAGANPPLDVHLTAIADATLTRQRWATWKPWAVAGGGLVVTGVGVVALLSARSLRDDYQAALTRECGELACQPDDLPVGTTDLLDRANFRSTAGIATVVIGGAAITAGVIMVVLNRPYTVLERSPTVSLTPTAGGAMLGVAGSL